MVKPMPITGNVLAWALEDLALTSSELAGRLSVSPSLVGEWIREDAAPNKGQFDALVRALGCTPSFLFLPSPPQESRNPEVQFRRHPAAPLEVPSETAAAMQTARAALRVANWLQVRSEADDGRSVAVPSAKRKDPPEQVAERLRGWLGWSMSAQTSSSSTDSSAAKAMRAALQKRGIVVLHLTMDEGLTRGFSFHEGKTSLIAVNTRDHVRARLFSYAHELVHLALRDDAVCLTRNDRGTEGYCNRVAAAILMPAEAYRSFVEQRIKGQVASRDQVVSIRNYFKVSLQAAAIRAATLGLAESDLIDRVEGEAESKGRGGTYIPGNERTRPRVRVDQYGSGFINSLLDAEDSGQLRRSQLLDLLRLSDRELETARGLATSGATG